MKKEKEILSLNSDFSEFNLQQLEDRLETDPLAIGGLVNFTANADEPMPACFINVCPNLTSCPELK
nr:hypothetical protein [uncultured Bacteroides sp.]